MNVNKHDCIKKCICHFLIGDQYQYTLTYIALVSYFFSLIFSSSYYYFFVTDVVVLTLFVWEANKNNDYGNQKASEARTCPPDSPCCSAL